MNHEEAIRMLESILPLLKDDERSAVHVALAEMKHPMMTVRSDGLAGHELTVRDYYVMAALQGLISTGCLDDAAGKGIDPVTNRNALVFAAFDIASACMAERNK